MTKKHFFQAFKTSIPVLFGYLAIGIAFGLMLVDKKYPIWLAPIMSTLMYAGAGQYIAIGLFAAGIPLSGIIITELLVNIRHIVYGLSLIEKFKNIGKWKPYLIFALTDETYSLLTTTDVPEDANPGQFYGTIALLDHLYWIIGGIIGALIGSIVQSKTNFSMGGVDFALTALFAVLLIEQIQKSKDFTPPIIGAFCTILGIFLWKKNILPNSNNILMISLVIGIAILLITKRNPKESTKIQEINDGN